MKAVQISAFGVPHEVGQCVELPDPGPPGPDEVVVQVEAFPINPADLLTLEGAYAVKPPLPATPGAEGGGRILAVGEAVRGLAPGDPVILLCRENWVQQRKTAAHNVIKVPETIDPLQRAMLKVNPATAALMLRNYVALQPGDWVIQDAANSGVGTALIRLAKASGWHTVNVVRRDDLAGPLKALGADAVLVDGEDLAERVAAATEGAPIRLGIDAVAGETSLRLSECLAEGGTLVNYGMLSGQPCMVRPDRLVFANLKLVGFWLAKHLTEAARPKVEELYAELAARAASGALSIAVEATYAIEDIKAALEHAAAGGRSGKVLVTPNGPL